MGKTLLLAALLAAGCGAPPAGRWGTPVRLAPASGIGMIHLSPQVAADGRGGAMAVWHEPLDDHSTGYRVRFSTFEPGKGWSAAETIVETGPYSGSQLAMNGSGEAVLGLSDWPSASVLRFIRGRGWIEPRSVGSGIVGGAQVAMGEDGSAIVLWAQPYHQPPALFASRFSPATGWSADDMISTARPPGYVPDISGYQVGIDARGNAVATWLELAFSPYSGDTLWSNHLEAGSRWGTPKPIEDLLEPAYPHLARSAGGTAIVVWQREGLRASAFRNGAWSPPRAIATPKRYACCPTVGVGESGDATALWLNWEESDGPMAVEAVRFDRDRGWSEPQPLPLVRASYESMFRNEIPGAVVVDGEGNATAVWNGEQGLVAHRYEAGRGWAIPHTIGVGWRQSEIALAVGGQGHVIAIWTAPDGTWVNRFE